MPGEKTEQPTARARSKARDKGQVARSQDLSSTMALLVVLGVAAWAPLRLAVGWRQFFAQGLGEAQGAFSPLVWLNRADSLVVRWSAPAMAAAWAMAILASLAQGGLVLAPEALTPKFERLNPASNLKQLFSPTGLSRLLKSLLPVAAMIYLAYAVYAREWVHLMGTAHQAVPALLVWLLQLCFEIGWKMALALLLWAGVDYALQRRQLSRQLRMSKEDIRDELKETEGNVDVKRRVRRLQMRMRRRRMLRDVPRATVVVVNPTEYAIALRYDPEAMAAPVVLAKGRDRLARQIKEIARWHEIPLVENPPLAHALYRAVEVGQAIPATLYTAVAEILAFLYNAQARMRPAAAGRA